MNKWCGHIQCTAYSSGTPHPKKATPALGKMQKGKIKLMEGLKHFPDEGMLRHLGHFRLKNKIGELPKKAQISTLLEHKRN